MKKIVYERTIHTAPYSNIVSKVFYILVHPNRYRRYVKKKEIENLAISYSKIYYRNCVEFVSDDIF